MNILIIEDDEMLAGILLFKLNAAGHKVHLAYDGKKAVDIVLDNQVDLVICDLMVPVISGVAFLVVRKKFMSLKVPVIVMSALENGEETLRNLDVDFRAFIQKPIDYEKLFELVESCGKAGNEEIETSATGTY